MSAPAFRETQRFRAWWIWLVVAICTAAGWWMFVQQIVRGQPFGSHPAPDWAVWGVWLVVGVATPVLFLLARLVTEVHADHVEVRWWPFPRKRIPFAQIRAHEVVTYRPIRDYGGWGVRFSFRNGIAWNCTGNRGVRLTLDGARPLLIGSERPEELAAALPPSTPDAS